MTRIRKVHLTTPEPTGLAMCGLDVLMRSPNRARVTCRRCLIAKTDAQYKRHRAKLSRAYYQRNRERVLARVKDYASREDTWEQRQAWIKANRYKLADYEIEVRNPRRRILRAQRKAQNAR